MNTTRRAIAATQALLIFPAIVFMGALIVRQLSPLQQEPAYTAKRIVMWCAGRIWTLWAFVTAMTLTADRSGNRGHAHAGELTIFGFKVRQNPTRFITVSAITVSKPPLQ